MKKIQTKKIVSAIISGIIAMKNKVFAISPSNFIGERNNRTISLYGVEPPVSIKAWNFFKMFVIPIALIVGIVIYLTKSKSSTKRKIITLAIILLIIIVIYFFVMWLETIYL